MGSDKEKLEKSLLFFLNIILEAKARAIVQMLKKYHSEWSEQELHDFLHNLVDYAIKKEKE